MSDVASFLETLYGHGSGWVHLSETKRQLAAVKCSDVAELVELIDGKTDVYLSAAVIGSDKGSGDGGRIENTDAVELTSLWVDLDRPGPGHKTKAKLWTRDDIGALWRWLPIQPTAVVDSGGGWWFYYVLTEPVPLNQDGTGELLLARWARWWHRIADERGRHMDGVFNAGRIVRAPGSINGKAGHEGRAFAYVKSLSHDRIFTPDQISEHLPAPEVPKRSEGYDWSQHDGERPGDVYNREATVESMAALLERHGFHSAKRKGGRLDLTRPGKDARDGSSATVWPDASVTFFSSTPEGLPGAVELRDKSGASGTYDPFGVLVAVEHAGDFQAAARALNPPSSVIVAPPPEDGAEEDFWTARPELERIRTYAQAQMAAPHAVLAVVLARVVCQAPTAVVLSDVIYDYASLNLTEALVGPSGGGKGGSTSVGAAAVSVGPPIFDTHTLGTGQGIAHGYGHYDGKAKTVVRHADSVLFIVEEVDHLAAHNAQAGSTTLAELRRFGMGEKLGAMYVDPKRRVEIGPHSYRGAVIVAVQPARAGVIIDATDGGTPQRFYWASTIDPHPPKVEPNRPEPWRWALPPSSDLPSPERNLRPIPVCETAAEAIRQGQRDRNAGRGDPLDGHALLTRERIAAALGILAGRYEVTEEDWQLAGHLMAVSDATRGQVIETLAERQREANRQRGKAEAERSVIVTEAVEDAAAKRVARTISRHLPVDSAISHSDLRKKVTSRDRGYFDDAIDRLLEAGQIDTVETEHGTHYQKAKT